MYNREKFRKLFDMEEMLEVIGLKDNQERFFMYFIRVVYMNINMKSNIKVLKNGEEIFLDIFKVMRKVEFYIYIEYYMFKFDMFGCGMMDIMMEKVC